MLLDTVNGWDPFHLVAHPVLSRLPYEVRTKAARELETRDMQGFMPHYFLYELVFETRFLPVYVKKMVARGLFCLENRHPRLFSLPPVPTEHNRSTLAAIMACAKRMEEKQRSQEEEEEEEDEVDDDDDNNEMEEDEWDEIEVDDDANVEEEGEEEEEEEEEVVFLGEPGPKRSRKRGRPKKRKPMPRGGQKCKDRERKNRFAPGTRKARAPKTLEVHQSLMQVSKNRYLSPHRLMLPLLLLDVSDRPCEAWECRSVRLCSLHAQLCNHGKPAWFGDSHGFF